jgi:short-subunit dehydrogenase
MSYYEKKVAFISGGASGIGRQLALDLGRLGATVIVQGRRREAVEEVQKAICDAGGEASSAVFDVRDHDAFNLAVHQGIERHGRLDLIFNCAGVGGAGEVRYASPEQWRTIIDTNLYGVVHGVVAAYPLMIRQGSGHIVNIASLAGLLPTPGVVFYSGSKHAVVGLSHSLRYEAANYNVRVSVVCPASVKTEIFEKASYACVDRQAVSRFAQKGMISAEQCSRAILKGVAKNKATIVPGAASIFVWLCKNLPWFGAIVCRTMAKAVIQFHQAGSLPEPTMAVASAKAIESQPR